MDTQHSQNCARHTPLAMKSVLSHQLKHGLDGLLALEAPGPFGRSDDTVTVAIDSRHLSDWLRTVAIDDEKTFPTEQAMLERYRADVRLPDLGIRLRLVSYITGRGVDDIARAVAGMTDVQVTGR